MAPRRAEVQIPVDELLIDGEERNPGLSWPIAVDRWLESKLDQARKAGMATSRKELAAALMTAIEPTDDELVDVLRSYRQRRAGELLKAEAGADIIEFRKLGPGPRSRRNKAAGQ